MTHKTKLVDAWNLKEKSYEMRTIHHSLIVVQVLSTELIDDNNHSELYYDLHLSFQYFF